MSKIKWDSKDKIIARLCVLIVLLILLLILMFILKAKQNEKEAETCGTPTGYTIEVAYNEYLNNLKEREHFTFYDVSKGIVSQYVITDQDDFYVVLNSKNKNYKSLKDKLVDISGLCDVDTCEQGIKLDSIKGVNVFVVEYNDITYAFVLDDSGNLYYIQYEDNHFRLVETDIKYAVQIYNSLESGKETIYVVDIQGKITEISDILYELK